MYKARIINSTDVTDGENSTSTNLRYIEDYSVQVTTTDQTPSADTFLAGVAEVATLTFDTQANTGDGDYVVVYDQSGTAWAVAADKTGSSAEPTGALWVSIPASNKAQADISGDTTAAQVAASFETAFDGISGFTSAVTSDDTAADGTMTMTQIVRGTTTDPIPKDATDAGAGSISVAETTAGVDSAVDTSTEYITMTSHGLATGTVGQLTSTGTLPAGVTTSTNYYVIYVDADNIQLASSLTNAQAGTAINLTDQGTSGATHTFTPTTLNTNVKLQASDDDTNWADISGTSTNITSSSTTIFNQASVGYKYVRAVITHTSGQVDIVSYITGKERRI